ncbi:MAG: hypothetical protein R3E77_11160 [Steroidobacteraceae bacterium]
MATQLSVIVAVEQAVDNLQALLSRLGPSGRPEVEVLLCIARGPDYERVAAADLANSRLIEGCSGARIPELWRDGIIAAASPRVALLTAHCPPHDDWLAEAMQLPVDARTVGIGGYFVNAAEGDALSWGIFLQRYRDYAQAIDAIDVGEIAADNAVYWRPAILQSDDLLREGFWEPDFHRRFRAAGCRLARSSRIRVEHRNVYTGSQFMAQRFAHGRQFGASRARQSGALRRAVLLASSPLIPLVVYFKILRGAMRARLLREAPALALLWLAAFCIAWGGGEALGLLTARMRSDMR